MSGAILEEFHRARREAKKLSLALDALHPSAQVPEEDKKELMQYLSYRKRSAVTELIRQGDLDGIKAMEKLGWLEAQYMAGYRAQASELHEMEVWAWLCGTAGKAEEPRGPERSSAEELCGRIWKLTGKKLRLRLPGMAETLGTMKFLEGERVCYLAGDGFAVYYDREALLTAYLDSPDLVARSLLHLTLHNLYLHPVLGRGKEERLWNLACDIQTERLLDRWNIRGLIRDGADTRSYLLKENGILRRWRSAEELYEALRAKRPEEARLLRLEEAFRIDDHRLWRKYRKKEERLPEGREQKGAPSGGEGQSDSVQFVRKWNRLRKEMGLRTDSSHQKAGTAAGGAVQEVAVRRKKGYDYRRFLEEFMVCREEVELDLENFDYLPYWYSRTHYRGIVFLEPLEYRETHKLDEMVIAIDTSGSCSGRVVRQFLEETCRILTERGNFFHKMQVHIIQCDSMIQEHVVVRSRDEFLDYIDHVTVKGLGGTDFRPVFRLVDQMIEEKQILHLKGLLYFTDGDGVYPVEKPAYETAFIFLNSRYEKQEIPEWGLRLNLGLKLEDE